ncbi:hypothetical protein J2X97_001038 [Epilithonimonas hungarica]|uniref:hypothetical protein n=1 Tax=Epilithonimonas hungarica TaxID=454006 RepID=UPI00277E40E6|nr:hypothetical protein [Epilithonimonas hungarica]MDP9955401.1 hypothetical protein [Epilithonimonas hungarica]
MKKLLLILTISPFVLSCDGQDKSGAKSLSEESLQLENFDFNTKISTLLPKETKSKEYAGYYKVKSEMIEVDTVADGEFIGSEKPVRIEYRQRSFSTRDVLANFDDFEFNAINFVTNMDGKLMLINAVAGETDKGKTEDFVSNLNKKYGNSKNTKSEFVGQDFDIYTWQLKDRIIRYCMVFDDEKSTLKIGGEKNPHYQSYLYVIKKEFQNQIFGNVSSGDFVFLE